MIKLTDDRIVISFPGIHSKLRAMAMKQMNAHLPRIQREYMFLAMERTGRWTYILTPSEERQIKTLMENRVRQIVDEYSWKASLEVSVNPRPWLDRSGCSFRLPPAFNVHAADHREFLRRAEEPEKWCGEGGVLAPGSGMHGHCLLNFDSVYPFAIKIGIDGTNLITGKPMHSGLYRHTQDYVTLPEEWRRDGRRPGRLIQPVTSPGIGGEASVRMSGGAPDIELMVWPFDPGWYFRRVILPLLPTTLAELATDGRDKVGNRTPERRARNESPLANMFRDVHDNVFAFAQWTRQRNQHCMIHLNGDASDDIIAGYTQIQPETKTRGGQKSRRVVYYRQH